MGTIPFPNIPQEAGEIAATPQNALAEYARVAALKQQTQQSAAMAPLQQQDAQQQIEAQRRQFADQDALTKAITQYDPAKHSLSDVPKLITRNGGSGQAALQAQAGLVKQRQDLTKLSDEQFSQQQKIADLTEGVHDEVSKAPPELKQAAYAKGLQTLSAAGADVSKEPAQYPGDDVFSQHLPVIRLHSAVLAEAEKDRELAAKEQTAAAETQKAQASDWKEGGGGTLVNVNPKSPQFGKILKGLGPVDQQELGAYLSAPKLQGEPLAPEQRNPATFLSWKAKQSPMAVVLGNQIGSGAALDQAAQRYSETGTLPAGFARSPGTTAAIVKRAAEINPTQNIAANSAAFKANEASLRGLQKNFDNVTAFENTAGKNLDVFLNQANKVIDSGSPWINKPLRSVDAGGLGSADQAAFNAARVTAVTEIAKVLNSANASGVLSDSARHEVEGLIGPNASLKQIVSAANVLKQDMANRHQAYQESIDAIRGRTQNTGGAAPQGGGMVTMKAPNGATKQVAPADVEHFKSLGATVVNQ